MGQLSQQDPEQGKPDQWSSPYAFVLATIGAAVGLGNIWRFSYVAGENGGGTFLLVYLALALLIGAPIVIAELAVGRHARGDAVLAFRRIEPKKVWAAPGALGVLGSFLVMSFYFVVAGWSARYFVGAVTGSLWEVAADEYGGFFDSFIAHVWEPPLWQFGMMAAAAVVVGAGVRDGIERLTRYLMPLLVVIVVLLAVYSATQTGSKAGLEFLFAPDWSLLRTPAIYMAALGQVMFSLSVGMALYLTYGSYLASDHRIPSAAVAVVAGDTSMAVLAGIAIFPAVFAFGVDPATGPRLAFITLPQIFLAMPAGKIVGTLFFFLLTAAALSASISGLKVPADYAARRFKLSRTGASWRTGLVIFVVGLPASLGYGVWRSVSWNGHGILETMDYFVSNLVLPIGGLVLALFVGWRWGAENALRESDLGESRVGRWWLWLLRIVIPVTIFLITMRGLELI